MNTNLKLNLEINLSSTEVDLMSVLAVGELSLVNDDVISGYIQGVIERLVIEPTQVIITSDMPLIMGAKAGYTGAKLTSYIRGWNQVGRRDDIQAPSNDSLSIYHVGFDSETKAEIVAGSIGEATNVFYELIGRDPEIDFDGDDTKVQCVVFSGQGGQHITPKFLKWIEEEEKCKN